MREWVTRRSKQGYILRIVQERDLRASLLEMRSSGFGGFRTMRALLDGRKKQRICAELGKHFDVYEARTLKEACSILWTHHPPRALELAGKRSLLELAEICSTSTTAIAAELAAQRPKKNRPAHARIVRNVESAEIPKGKKMVKMLIIVEPELKAYALEAAAQAGHRNVSKLIRRALWKEVVLLVPNAPQFQPARCVPHRLNSRGAKRAVASRDAKRAERARQR